MITYLARFFAEKDIDQDAVFSVAAPGGTENIMSYSVVIESIGRASKREQEQIADVIRRIDFANGDVCHFLRHLAGALARDI